MLKDQKPAPFTPEAKIQKIIDPQQVTGTTRTVPNFLVASKSQSTLVRNVGSD